MMRIRETIRDNGFIGLLFIPICWFIGHDFNIGRKCIRCSEPKKRLDY